MNIVPYIIFNGNCEEALNYYAEALNGEVKELMRYAGTPAESMAEDKQHVMHATLAVKGNVVMMASDRGQGGPSESGSAAVNLSLDFKNENEMVNVFSKLSDSGTVTMQLQDTFWDAKFGMLTDKYGIKWMFNHQKK